MAPRKVRPLKKEGVSAVVDLNEITILNAKEKMAEWIKASEDRVVYGVMVSCCLGFIPVFEVIWRLLKKSPSGRHFSRHFIFMY